MSNKTITLATDAYERLRVLKNERESFSSVVRRLTTPKLSNFAGLLSKAEVDAVESVIRKGRVDSRKRAVAMVKEFK